MQSEEPKKNIEKNNLLANDQRLLALERTKLANERTFLSWVRTGLSCVGGGIAIIKFINFNAEVHRTAAKISGDILIVTGIIFLIFSLINYKNLKNHLPEIEGFKETSTALITASVYLLTIVSIVFLFII